MAVSESEEKAAAVSKSFVIYWCLLVNSYTEQKEALTLFPSHFFAQRIRRSQEKTTVERKPTRAFDGGRASVRGETKFVFPGGGRKTEHIMPFDIGYCLWLRLN